MGKKTSPAKSQEEIEAELIDKVSENLQPALKKHIASLRTDLLSDFQELMKKQAIPAPEKESAAPGTMDMSGLMKGLQNGNLDMAAIGKMIGGMTPQQPAAGADGKLIDIKDLTPGQIEFMKMQQQQQQQNTLMTTILPMLLQQGQGMGAGGGMMSNAMGEMMNRVFMSGVLGDQYMKKMMFSMLSKKSESPEVYAEYSKVHDALINPIGSAVSGLTGQQS